MATISLENEYFIRETCRKESDSAANKTTVVTSVKLITEQDIFTLKLLEIQLRIAVSLNRHLLFQFIFKRHAILINTGDRGIKSKE